MEYWVRDALSAAVARMHVCASQYRATEYFEN